MIGGGAVRVPLTCTEVGRFAVATVHRIGPANRPATLAEVRQAVALLLREYADNEDTVGALGLVAGLLETVQCHCSTTDVDPVPAIPLPTTRRRQT